MHRDIASADTVALLDEAIALQNAGHLGEAGNLYLRILAVQPNHPHALHMLGVVLFSTDQPERGLHLLQRAERVQAATAELCNNIGATLHQLGRLDEAMTYFDRAVAVDPEFGFAWSNRALALQQLRRFDEALVDFERAMALKPDDVNLRWHAGFTRLQLGDFARGWADYEWRWRGAIAQAAGTEGPRFTGAEDVADKTVLLHAEQGFGDTLQFCRYAPLLAGRGAQVVLAVQQPLVRLLASLPAVSVIDVAGPLPEFDLQCPLLSLPLAFATELDTIPADTPYLTADPAAVAQWRVRLGEMSGLKVGLVWAGGPRPEMPEARRIDQRRSMRLADLAPLAGLAGVHFFSLQKGPPAAQAVQPPPGMVLHDWTSELADFADTAALVSALDVLVSVDTAVAHLGGALGISTLVMNRHDTCWRWLDGREDTPWYPTMRMFTQSRPGDWAEVVERVAAAVAALGA